MLTFYFFDSRLTGGSILLYVTYGAYKTFRDYRYKEPDIPISVCQILLRAKGERRGVR